MEFGLPVNIKISVLEQELTQVQTEMYRLSIRHAVQEKLGRKQNCETLVKDMESVQEVIQFYEEELDKIISEQEENENGDRTIDG